MNKSVRVGVFGATFIIVLIVGVSIGFAQKHKSKNETSIPAGHAVLWRDPGVTHELNLLAGPGGESMRPDLSQVTLIEKEKGGGYSTKYRVRDASGNEWSAKIGKEAQSETAASRLLWGVGYFTEINYLVPSVRIEGLNKTLTNVRFSARPKDIKRL